MQFDRMIAVMGEYGNNRTYIGVMEIDPIARSIAEIKGLALAECRARHTIEGIFYASGDIVINGSVSVSIDTKSTDQSSRIEQGVIFLYENEPDAIILDIAKGPIEIIGARETFFWDQGANYIRYIEQGTNNIYRVKTDIGDAEEEPFYKEDIPRIRPVVLTTKIDSIGAISDEVKHMFDTWSNIDYIAADTMIGHNIDRSRSINTKIATHYLQMRYVNNMKGRVIGGANASIETVFSHGHQTNKIYRMLYVAAKNICPFSETKISTLLYDNLDTAIHGSTGGYKLLGSLRLDIHSEMELAIHYGLKDTKWPYKNLKIVLPGRSIQHSVLGDPKDLSYRCIIRIDIFDKHKSRDRSIYIPISVGVGKDIARLYDNGDTGMMKRMYILGLIMAEIGSQLMAIRPVSKIPKALDKFMREAMVMSGAIMMIRSLNMLNISTITDGQKESP